VDSLSRQQWERAQAAFYPFVHAFSLPLNPDDVDEILYAVLTHIDTEMPVEQIAVQVQAQIQTYLAQARAMYIRSPSAGAAAAVQERTTPGSEPRSWVVWRQDDHGNRVEVARHAARADAEEQVAALESRGHKQTYWVSQAGT